MMHAILTGDARDKLRDVPSDSIDALCTDPPYGLNAPPNPLDTLAGWLFFKESKIAKGRGFMGSKWDAEVPPPIAWEETFRVLKPGAYGLVFAGARTLDLMGLSLRIAGFEIRDCLQWIYGQGYPSGNRKGPAEGLGTRLKPAQEPILLVRKPLEGKTVDANFSKHGVGFLDIDAARVPVEAEDFEKLAAGVEAVREKGGVRNGSWANDSDLSGANPANPLGRWPANLVIDEHAGNLIDAQTGKRPGMRSGGKHAEGAESGIFGKVDSTHTARGDNGGASRFFYCAKTSRAEKDEGLEHREAMSGAELTKRKEGQKGLNHPAAGAGRTSGGKNPHPTVKPVDLMRWCVALVTPKPGAVVLDPYAGTGTTGIACALEGHSFLGIELDDNFADVARERIAHWRNKKNG